AVTSPTFDVAGVEAGATVQLMRDGVVVASIFSVGGGTVSMHEPSELSDGAYAYTAQQTDAAGNVGALSGATSVTIDTTGPAATSAPDLQAASASGSSTSVVLSAVTSPTFAVAGVGAGSTVQLLRDGVVVASVFSAGGGTVSMQE